MATGGQSSSSQDAASEDTTECFKQSCEPCARNESSTAATVFCKECKELLCDACRKPHMVYKHGKHELVSLLDMDTTSLVVDMKVMDRCEEHGKKIEFYCEDHEKLCCSTCVLMHRKFDRVCEIESVSVEKCQTLKKDLERMESETDSIIADCKKSENDLNDSIANISKTIDKVDEMKFRIIKLFDQKIHKVFIDANAFKADEIKRIQTTQASFAGIKQDINRLSSMYMSDQKTPVQMYLFAKQIEERQKMIETFINEHRERQIFSRMPVAFQAELSTLLDNENAIKTAIKNPVPVQTNEQASPSSGDTSDLFQELTLQQLVSMDLKQTEGDKGEPFLSGMDFMQDGRLIAVDCWNRKCLILNERLQIQGIPYKFKYYPYDVVCLSKYEFAVTVGDKTVVLLFVSPDNVISLISELNTSSYFETICCITRSNMVVSTINDPRPVRMITVDGVESDFDHVEFTSKTYASDESKSAYVQSKNTLVLTDRYANTVYLYDTVRGTSRAVTNENIQEPRGACVGPGDTVFVCSQNIHSIVHLTVDGDILSTYPVDMNGPNSLCMNRNTSTLAVSNCCKGKKETAVIQNITSI